MAENRELSYTEVVARKEAFSKKFVEIIVEKLMQYYDELSEEKTAAGYKAKKVENILGAPASDTGLPLVGTGFKLLSYLIKRPLKMKHHHRVKQVTGLMSGTERINYSQEEIKAYYEIYFYRISLEIANIFEYQIAHLDANTHEYITKMAKCAVSRCIDYLNEHGEDSNDLRKAFIAGVLHGTSTKKMVKKNKAQTVMQSEIDEKWRIESIFSEAGIKSNRIVDGKLSTEYYEHKKKKNKYGFRNLALYHNDQQGEEFYILETFAREKFEKTNLALADLYKSYSLVLAEKSAANEIENYIKLHRNSDPIAAGSFNQYLSKKYFNDQYDITGICYAPQLKDKNLAGGNFDGSVFLEASLQNCDLSTTSFKNATLIETDFRDALITNTVFTGAKLHFSDLSAIDSESTGIRFDSAELCFANMQNTDYGDASFVEADLRFAEVSGANFLRADLTDAKTEYSNMHEAVKDTVKKQTNRIEDGLETTNKTLAHVSDTLTTLSNHMSKQTGENMSQSRTNEQQSRAEFSLIGKGGTANKLEIDKLTRSETALSVPPGVAIDPSIAALLASMRSTSTNTKFNIVGDGGHAGTIKIKEQHDAGALALEVRNPVSQTQEQDPESESEEEAQTISLR